MQSFSGGINIFKFGGASVRNADAIRNIAEIVRSFSHYKLVIVISAMGKSTNALETIAEKKVRNESYENELERLKSYHVNIAMSLLPGSHPVHQRINELFGLYEESLLRSLPYPLLYDQTVCYGELISTSLVSAYLHHMGIPCQWIDARHCIMTDSTFQEAKIDWEETEKHIKKAIDFHDSQIFLTQGFIGSHGERTTTLGREGSDFTAAIFASCLKAKGVTIWKDVPGILNADPKIVMDAVLFEELPYREAAEMTYYGASVIHPKTIKPLANKQIPLFVKSFDQPDNNGTVIHNCLLHHPHPSIIFKKNQCLITFQVKDYTFVNEGNLSVIFHAFARLNLKINLMQNSAISFSVCTDYDHLKIEDLIADLKADFDIYYNTGLTLLTIKNYDQKTLKKYSKVPAILLEQLTRNNYQIVISEHPEVVEQRA